MGAGNRTQLLVLARLLQGLSVGGEATTAMVFLVEQAPPGRRGLVGSFCSLAATGGFLLGSAIGAAFAWRDADVRPAAAIAPGLWAAGDYVEGPYPATLEGAVRSGLAAGQAV